VFHISPGLYRVTLGLARKSGEGFDTEEADFALEVPGQINAAVVATQAPIYERISNSGLGGHPKPADGGHLKTGQ
jgi:hypothetical protein